MQEIPEGDWFCPWCKPPELLSPRRLRDANAEEDKEEEEEEKDDEDDNEKFVNGFNL